MTEFLANSMIYKKVIPIVLSILGSIYCIVFLIRFLLWYFIEPYHDRQFRSNCRKCERFFHQHAQNLERPSEIYQPAFRARHVSLETLPFSKKASSPAIRLNRPYSKHYLELWQWCVAVGYLKYEHGERLNLIILNLENKDNIV